ncbi:MAG: hypothetical protein AB1792_11110 [Candidatus Zixiibacteriota bacterium]
MSRTAKSSPKYTPVSWWRPALTVLVVVTSALAAYYTTVYGIRLTVTEKADRVTVDQIDRRLVEIETTLRTDVARRRDLASLETALDARLTRIETLLEERRMSR